MNLCSIILWSSVTNQKFLIVKRLAIGRATLSQVAHPNTQKNYQILLSGCNGR
jgi:hypothetical protein